MITTRTAVKYPVSISSLKECIPLQEPPKERRFLNRSLLLDNEYVVLGKDDGTVQVRHLLNDHVFETHTPIVDLEATKRRYEDNHGCGSNYCVEGFRFSGTFSAKSNCIFLLADFTSPELFVLSLDKPGEFQRLKWDASITCVTSRPDGRILVGTSGGNILMSDEPYQYGDKVKFSLIGSHNIGNSVDSIILLDPPLLASSANNDVRIFNMDTKRCVKELPNKQGLLKLKAAPGQLVAANEFGMKAWDTTNWTSREFKEQVIDLAQNKNYLAIAVLNKYEPDKVNYDRVTADDDLVTRRKKITGIHFHNLQAKQSQIKIKLFDTKNWRCIGVHTYKTFLEDNISLKWTPSGQLMIYEKFNTNIHPLLIQGLRIRNTPSIFMPAPEEKQAEQKKEEGTTLKLT